MGAVQQALLMGAGLQQAPQVPFANVKILMHFDGADGSTTMTDVIGHTFTAADNAQIDTAQSVFGGASLLLDGTNDRVTAADSADFTLGSSDFTLECRVRFSNVANGRTIAAHYDTSGNNRAWIWYYQNNGLEFVYNTNGTSSPGNVSVNTAWVPSANVWYTLMVCRIGNTLYQFIDGVLMTTADVTGVTIFNPAVGFRIGCRGSAGSNTDFMAGWLDEFRLSVGTGRSAVSYAVDTAAFPDS